MLNPKIDVVFRKLFGSEENKDLLISLINSVVEPTPPIVDVTIKNPYNLAAYRDAKESILDIKAVDSNGTWYDIEMQIEAHILYGRRAVYYLSKTFAGQLESGQDYSNLNTTIGIHFLDFEYFEDDRVVRQFVFKDAQTNAAPAELGCVRLYFVEMTKFNKDWSEIRTTLDRWIAFLNKARDMDRAALSRRLAGEPAVSKAVVELEKIGLNREEREIYEGEVRRHMVDAIQIKTAEERGIQHGRQAGLREGLQEGRQEGMAQLILGLMTARFGDTPASIRAKVANMNPDALTELGAALLACGSLAEVETWLSSHEPALHN